MLSECPCHNCPKREILCKLTCPHWKQWSEENAERRKAINKKKQVDWGLYDEVANVRGKAKKSRHREVCGW